VVAVVVLAVAMGLESFSLRTAVHESRPLKGSDSWFAFIRHAKVPELPVVLLEDVAALIGLVLAFAGVGLSATTHKAVWDGIGTCAIGVLLVTVAVVLVIETKSLLVGEAAAPAQVAAIANALVGPGIERVIHLRTMHLGPEELLVGAKVAMPPGATLDDVAAAIDAAEQRVRTAVPSARVIYLEPDVDRAPAGRQSDVPTPGPSGSVPAVVALDGVARNYAWGSPTAIPGLLGIEPDGRPVAELWFGAHPDDPSPAADHASDLEALIAADPVGLLGAATVDRFGPRLPFLLKILAADRALSIQVHPNLEQAQAGFAAEQARGIPQDSPERNYRDPNHKPELLCALTPFEALCGFRPVADTLRLLDELDIPELAVLRDLLSGPDGLRAAFTHVLALPDPALLVAEVTRRAAAIPAESEWAGTARAVAIANADFPGDVGAVLALLLNYIRLEPAEAIYLDAGNVHAYLRGTGIEVMANSDNVLRCGLTPKHVDVAELLKVTDFTPLTEPRRLVQDSGSGRMYETLVPDFSLSTLDLDDAHDTDDTDDTDDAHDAHDAHAEHDAHHAHHAQRAQHAEHAEHAEHADIGRRVVGSHGPHIVLCLDGHARVEALGASVELTPGHAAFVAARESAFTVHGTGGVALATVGADV
ncbi:MAG: Mannose-6-phosphate isomerase, type 1, partial [Pseudonocardiales bacterium]|nr:Mannose-6-phosphate isomerase, type 1 [Pseudonocardiales bacterium]